MKLVGVAALVVFVVSVVVLFVMIMLTSGGKATGLGVLKLHGMVFIYVGALYLLAGLIMRFAIRY
jgi:hypothetical protein